MKKILCHVFITAVFTAAAALSGERSENPMDFLKTSVEEVIAIVYDSGDTDTLLSERLHPILKEHFDLALITRRAVGRPWLEFEPDQQEEVIELFSTLVLRTYVDRFEPKSRPAVEFGNAVELRKNRWELPTTVVYEGNNYAVAYRVYLDKSGAWRIYDVIVEGVSMVGNYRAQFDSIIQKGGASALLEALTKNIAQGTGAS